EEYDQLCTVVNKIAHPLASRKLAKKIYKLIKKRLNMPYILIRQASQEKNYLRQGIKDVHKAIRRNEKGIVILAGDVSPLDIYSHMPALCEAKDLLYVFTPSRKHLGLATGSSIYFVK
ncbi:unnamed protein product, partial [Anisakis simplex]|uniref:Ribosomal_L7Ae domain-containing protein n=1 Tax=Anisakis simplex TaxID=6269 RepID=A0A0M3JCQ5_ANISI